MINIRDFGAVGEGITLDTAAVQKALDCCNKKMAGPLLYQVEKPIK